MHVMVELCVIPIGSGLTLSGYIAACQKEIQAAGLKHQLHAYGTNIEGEWDDVFAVVKRCHEVLHDLGAPRLFTSLKVGTRTDKNQSLDEKVTSVQQLLDQSSG